MNAGSFDRQAGHLLLPKAKVPSCLLRDAAWGCPKLTAAFWKEQRLSLREICLNLKEQGHSPKRGGQRYPQTVTMLLVS